MFTATAPNSRANHVTKVTHQPVRPPASDDDASRSASDRAVPGVMHDVTRHLKQRVSAAPPAENAAHAASASSDDSADDTASCVAAALNAPAPASAAHEPARTPHERPRPRRDGSSYIWQGLRQTVLHPLVRQAQNAIRQGNQAIDAQAAPILGLIDQTAQAITRAQQAQNIFNQFGEQVIRMQVGAKTGGQQVDRAEVEQSQRTLTQIRDAAMQAQTDIARALLALRSPPQIQRDIPAAWRAIQRALQDVGRARHDLEDPAPDQHLRQPPPAQERQALLLQLTQLDGRLRLAEDRLQQLQNNPPLLQRVRENLMIYARDLQATNDRRLDNVLASLLKATGAHQRPQPENNGDGGSPTKHPRPDSHSGELNQELRRSTDDRSPERPGAIYPLPKSAIAGSYSLGGKMERHGLDKALLSIQINKLQPDLINQVTPLINSGRIKFDVTPQAVNGATSIAYETVQNTEIATIRVHFQHESSTQKNAQALLALFQKIVDRFSGGNA
ncbi:hypothetical protein [Burkholderia sp. TSV86]|uniref:hypothetical protein n=1 Tax=Burkholderia sp. TSV86 TaxID=1385594 RepID=UPI000757F842|nr:hypothetical protein [Burkholderia sp. TSV86]KVE37894.1 hypothetical protein WS68_25260 [Burkholderia sp. TSV86]